jgi:hypothetical protein
MATTNPIAPAGAALCARIPDGCDPRVAMLWRYWQSRAPAPHLLPGRQHLVPSEIQGLLRNVFLCDVVREPVRFRYRLIGSTISSLMERDDTGAWLDEAHPQFAGSVAEAEFVAAAEAARPAYYRGPPTFHMDRDYLWMERLLLPLARNGADVDMLVGITLYGPARNADGEALLPN